MITIIGTSHISKESIQSIKKFVEEEKPEIIALELDQQRAASLMDNNKRRISINTIPKIGIKGYLFALIGQYIQGKLGKIIGTAPGSDMKTGLLLARKHNLKIALIDQPIEMTLRNFSKSLTWKEKFRFFGDILMGLLFPKRQIQKYGLDKIDLKKVPEKEVIKKMMNELKERFPNVYKSLVSDRNKYMIKNLIGLQRANPDKKILVIVGAGHEDGMKELLRKIDVL